MTAADCRCMNEKKEKAAIEKQTNAAIESYSRKWVTGCTTKWMRQFQWPAQKSWLGWQIFSWLAYLDLFMFESRLAYDLVVHVNIINAFRHQYTIWGGDLFPIERSRYVIWNRGCHSKWIQNVRRFFLTVLQMQFQHGVRRRLTVWRSLGDMVSQQHFV